MSRKDVCDQTRDEIVDMRALFLNWYDKTNSHFRKHNMPVHVKFTPKGYMNFDFTNKLGKNYWSSLQISKWREYRIEEFFVLNDKTIKHKSL